MPVNRNALIRYKTLDNCLRNYHRQWTLEDLIEKVSDALYEFEGISKGVSKRTVQMDLQLMRSDKLGYNAPIIVVDKKFYKYEDKDYSITNIPITEQDIHKLNEVVELLKQFKGFSHFTELNGMVQKLEDKIYTAKSNQGSIIDFEKNEFIKGLEYIDTIYTAIKDQKTLILSYKSFNARQPEKFVFHAYLLKEYRNRWFVIGEKDKKGYILNLALDRILSIEFGIEKRWPAPPDLSNYFNDVLGVTVNRGVKPLEILVFFDFKAAPYVLTKPIHHSQKVIEKTQHGLLISLTMQWNFELEREILGFGSRARIISPQKIVKRMENTLSEMIESYKTAPEKLERRNIKDVLESKGSVVINQYLSIRFINEIKGKILKQIESINIEKRRVGIRRALVEIPTLKNIITHQKIQQLIQLLGNDYFITKSIFFDKLPSENWYVTWHQDITINVADKIETEGFRGWSKKEGYFSVIPPQEILESSFTIRIHLDDASMLNGCLEVLPGSHKKIHDDSTIQLIQSNSQPYTVEVPSGGIHIMKPLILHASKKAITPKTRKVLHLEFCNKELPNGLKWAEKMEL